MPCKVILGKQLLDELFAIATGCECRHFFVRGIAAGQDLGRTRKPSAIIHALRRRYFCSLPPSANRSLINLTTCESLATCPNVARRSN